MPPKIEIPEEKLERAKQMRLEADEAWVRGSKEHSTYLHGAAAQLKKEAEAEIAARRAAAEEAAQRMMNPRISSKDIVSPRNIELTDAIKEWRGLTEEQRTFIVGRVSLYGDSELPPFGVDAAKAAARLLKAAAR